jgi:hypothetical protein
MSLANISSKLLLPAHIPLAISVNLRKRVNRYLECLTHVFADVAQVALPVFAHLSLLTSHMRLCGFADLAQSPLTPFAIVIAGTDWMSRVSRTWLCIHVRWSAQGIFRSQFLLRWEREEVVVGKCRKNICNFVKGRVVYGCSSLVPDLDIAELF